MLHTHAAGPTDPLSLMFDETVKHFVPLASLFEFGPDGILASFTEINRGQCMVHRPQIADSLAVDICTHTDTST